MKTIYWVFSDGEIKPLKVTAETELSLVGISETGTEFLFHKERENQFWYSNIESAKKEAEKIFAEKMDKNNSL